MKALGQIAILPLSAKLRSRFSICLVGPWVGLVPGTSVPQQESNNPYEGRRGILQNKITSKDFHLIS